ncbi:MAG: putative Ig domain-containing protein [Deltaproteobacteria bacterium]|nr:putative Ig domain-containing protein [Deltaproteobacteria bacterium]
MDIDPANYQGDIDIVRFIDGILPADLHLKWDGYSLTLTTPGNGDQLVLDISYFGGYHYYGNFEGKITAGIEQLEFSDGTVWEVMDLLPALMVGTEGGDYLYGTYLADTITGYGGNDRLEGFEGDDLMAGGAGNDALFGGIGSDTIQGDDGDDVLYGNWQGSTGEGEDDNILTGGAGNDELHGDRGNDIMRGGTGNDTLYGGEGKEYYFFDTGDGGDVIYNGNYDLEYRVDWFNPDIIRLGEGITSADITVSRDGDNLVLAIGASGDSLTLGSWFGSMMAAASRGEQLEFADGTVWDVSDLADRAAGLEGPILAGAEGDDTLVSSEYWSDEILLGKGGADLLVGGIGCDWLDGGDGDDLLYGDTEGYDTQPLMWWDGVLDDRLDGGSGDDILYGGAGRDVLLGADGNDQLFGDTSSGGNTFDLANDMADTLNGGTGNDSLAGGEGDDTYVFTIGDGIDIINDHQNHDQDHLSLGPGMTTADLTGFSKSGNDLIVKVGTNGDQLTLTNWFGGRYGQLDVAFGDGTVLSAPELMALTPFYSLSGSSATDYLYGGNGDDVLDGGNDNDYLYAYDGDNQLSGGAGDDILDGGAGADLLDGGAGNDTLNGGDGDDIYVFGRGYGHDTVYSLDQYCNANSVVQLLPDVAPSEVLARYANDNSNDLVLSIAATNDTLTITGFFDPNYGQYWRLDGVEFGDGAVWDADHLTTLANEAANEAVLIGTGGDDVLTGSADNDILQGGAGNDLLSGGDGDDTYIFNPGDGVDRIVDGGGTDTIQFGDGITSDSLSLGLGSLLVRVGEQGEAIHIEDFNPAEPLNSSVIETFQFADGTVLTMADLLQRGFDIRGSAGDDWLAGTAIHDRITGDEGADTLAGGKGDDVLVGGAGNDTYLFNLGDGQDIIEDVSSAGEGNRLTFGTGIAASDLALEYLDGDLLIHVGEQGDALRLKDFDRFGNNGSLVADTLHFADGSQASLFALANTAPVVTVLPENQAALEDVAYSFTFPADIFSNVDAGDSLTYSAKLGNGDALPGWLAFDPVTGTFSGIPANSDVGNLEVAVTATDTAGALAVVSFSLEIANVNDAPFVATHIPGQSALENSAFSFTVPADAFADVDAGDWLTCTASLADASALPSWLVFDAGTRTFSGTPTSVSAGLWNVCVTVTDTEGASASDDFVLDVANHIVGTAAGDSLVGTVWRDVIEGLAGRDTLQGNEGDDIFLIEGADISYDTVSGGDGFDTVLGGSGDDVIRLSNFSEENTVEMIDGGAGINSIAGDNYANTIDLSKTILVNIARIESGLGGDTVIGFTGNDIIIGGGGRDNLQGNGGDELFLIEGVDDDYDTVSGGDGFDKVQGGVGNDVIRLGNFSGVNTVEMIDGGAGINSIEGDNYANTIDLSNTLLMNIARIESGLGGDTVIGSAAGDIIIGGGGKDNLQGGGGDDLFLIEGVDDDYDIFTGDDGFDTVLGGDGDDVIRLSNFSGTNSVEMIDGGAGINSIAGTDYGNVIDLSNTTLVNIAYIESGLGCDTVIGSAADDIISGGGGQDNLQGGGGDDLFLLEGVDDDYDTFNGGDGFDTVQGGDGDDVIRLSNFSGINTVETIDGGAGANSIAGTDYGNVIDLSNTTLVNIAYIESGLGCDTVIGSAADDIISGNGGNDSLTGKDGDDTYCFNLGDGADTINNYDTTGLDAVSFGEGIDQSGVGLFRNGNNLEIGYSDLDKVSVSNFFTNANYMVDEVDLVDGSYLGGADINRIIQDMAAFAVNEGITLSSVNDVRNNEQLMTIVANGWQA